MTVPSLSHLQHHPTCPEIPPSSVEAPLNPRNPSFSRRSQRVEEARAQIQIRVAASHASVHNRTLRGYAGARVVNRDGPAAIWVLGARARCAVHHFGGESDDGIAVLAVVAAATETLAVIRDGTGVLKIAGGEGCRGSKGRKREHQGAVGELHG